MSFDYWSKRRMQYFLEKIKGKIPTALSSLTDDTTHRLVSDTEKSTWNAKSTLGLGETSSTAYRGDRGKTAYDHSQLTSGNPHGVTKSDVGLGNVGNFKAVSTVASQGLTDTEKSNARSNIGAGTSSFDGAYSSLTGKPTLGTAAAKDVPSSGNASTTQVVMGNDSRLTNARNAADVYSWAKASTKPSYTASEVGAIASSLKGAASGVAELDSNGKVPSSQLPSYVDDVLEYDSLSNFPTTGETGKIYVAKDTNKTYRWSGTAYVEISPSLALGETSSTAYRGDRGKTAYDHSQSTHARTDATAVTSSTTNGNIKINGTETTVYTHPGSGTNPHGTTKSDVGLGNVGNFKAVSTVASQGLTDTEKSNARTNIGAGTSSLTIGSTASTAAAGNHTHSTSIAADSGTNQLTLAANTKYKLTAGGTGFVFTTPPDTTYSSKAAASGGTDVSLVTTGEKYTWNNKSNLALGTTSSTAFRGDYGNSAYAHAVTNKGSAFTSGLYKITTNSEGHVTAATAVVKADITGLGIPGSDTNNRKAFFGTCDTAAATAAKTVTLSDTSGWELKAGTIVGIKFTNSNSASSVTLNVNGSGDKSIYYNGSVFTGNTSWITGQGGNIIFYMYDGTNWVWMNFGWHSDGNNNVTQTATTTNADYEVLFSVTADNTTRTEAARKNSNLKFNPSTGNLQATQLNGVTIGSSPKFTDTTYSSKAAASGGTDVSLVTTGEKYTWNNKSNLAIGTTATTAAAGNHTHTASLATDTGTSSISLAANTKYKLTAGGSSIIFTTPPDNDHYAWSDITGKPSSYTPSSHTHGNIQNGGTLQTNDITIASGDKLVVTDSSDSAKVARTSISFDGSTATKALTQKGTWETFGTSNLAIGTTATTAAAGNHTHTASIAADSGTNQLTMAANTKYKLTAGGSTYIFTTPPDTNTWRGIQNNLTSDSTTESLSAKQGKNLANGSARDSTKVMIRGSAGKSNMNDIGRLTASTGMTNLSDPSNNVDNPLSGTTKSTGWHHYWDTSYSDDPNGSNAWVTQMCNKAGTNQWWVRSRSGGTITNGTAWTAGWEHLVVSPQTGQGGTTTPIYIDANGHTQNCSYTIAKSVPSDAVFTDHYAWSDITGKPSSYTPASHTHGNIQNGGTLQTNDVTIASGDKLVITDSSDSAKVARASISFDGSTATKCLTQKGTWETFTNNTGTITGSGTSGYIAKWNGGSSITNGPAFGSSTTTFLRNDGTWASPGATYFDSTKTLSTTDSTTFTFSNAAITANSCIDVYCTIYGFNPLSVSASAGSCTVVFPPYDSATDMTCRIYVK